MTDQRDRLGRTCLIAGIMALVLPLIGSAAAMTTEGAGADPASIQGAVDAFRGILGDPNNGNDPGPLPSGRREINWDGGGSTVASPAGTPFDGFQASRGALFTTPGTGFLQTPLDAPELLAINPTYQTTFQFFSPVRIFTAVDSNITDATFMIPGNPAQQAVVTGFGVIFSDVDVLGSATLEFFDLGDNLLGVFSAPVFNGGLSFLGVDFTGGEKIGRVRITSGNVAPGPNDAPGSDVVMMDDFFYGEPQVVPEPTSLLLLSTGLALFGAGVMRRRKKEI